MLHSRPWSESSLLVDVFTREHGRFRVLAKGARRQKTGSRAQLQSFQKLQISWSGRRSLHTLTGVETNVVRPTRMHRTVLASLYYMNELVFKFLHANDAHEDLFDAYDECVQRLTAGEQPEDILRFFECALLSEIGYGLILDRDTNTGETIDETGHYFYYPERGPVRVDTTDSEQALQISGACLTQLSQRRFTDAATRKDSKRLLRNLLTRQIRGGEFRTRKVFSDLLRYAPSHAD
ncbi:MAG: DNA repair protein RecO (recombination protein O) [Saprospiraceae bacterium]|jgi:DNA repair protein RecO (recombination protein O)